MEAKSLETTVKHLVGHIVVESSEEKRRFKQLLKSLEQCDLTLDKSGLSQSRLSIEKTDMFFDEKIPQDRLKGIRAIAAKQQLPDRKNTLRVFVREIPVQEKLLAGTQPEWATGAKVDHTIGPLQKSCGRTFWFDFYPLVKLAALYIQGNTEPILLCNLTKIQNTPNRPTRLQRYTIAGQTVWLNAHFLTVTAPQGQYIGIRVKNGLLTLNKNPTTQGDRLIVPADTRIGIDLELHQEEQGEQGQSKTGADARNSDVLLPERFAFTFAGSEVKITALGKSSWKLYGQKKSFAWIPEAELSYNPLLKRILIPLKPSARTLKIGKVLSPWNTVAGEAKILTSAWALPLAAIDIDQPMEAAGTGELMVQTDSGLKEGWLNVADGTFFLNKPVVLASPAQFIIADLTQGNPQARFSVALWQDELNEAGTSADFTFAAASLFLYICNGAGNEVIATFCKGDFKIDRPVKVNGEPAAVKSQGSLLVVTASDSERHIGVYDENLLHDASMQADGAGIYDTIAFALKNGLFTTTRANGCLLFGSLSPDFRCVESGSLYLTFALIGYLPALPDPYAANLGTLADQYKGHQLTDHFSVPTFSGWFVCRIAWQVIAAEKIRSTVEVSFHFAPFSNQFAGISLQQEPEDQIDEKSVLATDLQKIASVHKLKVNTTLDESDITSSGDLGNLLSLHNLQLRADTSGVSADTGGTEKEMSTKMAHTAMVETSAAIYEDRWDKATEPFHRSLFTLLDVSTRADLQGISFDDTAGRGDFFTTHVAVENQVQQGFPLQVENMEVVSRAAHVKSFTVPQISWEPLVNLSWPSVYLDPPLGPNYYPNDGGPTRMVNNGEETVALAPLPLNQYLVDGFTDEREGFEVTSLFTLPFGMKALALLKKEYSSTDESGSTSLRRGAHLSFNSREFEGEIKGGLQLQLQGGEAVYTGESDMFVGSTVQLTNVLDAVGKEGNYNTLGGSVSSIFNNDFLLSDPAGLIRERGVPLTRIDLSGYGATTFSNWLSPDADFAATSQARFDVITGRCGHEIVQVKSVVVPWGIKVVRTITLFRVESGYIFRHDSGWKAQSDGRYDFRFFVKTDADTEKVKKPSPYLIHPGLVRGLFNVENIVETTDIDVFAGTMKASGSINNAGYYTSSTATVSFALQPVYFDADVWIDGLCSGCEEMSLDGISPSPKVTPSRKIVGFVQLAPKGIPINDNELQALVVRQLGAISGSVDCEVDLAGSGQKMRLNRFDFSNVVSPPSDPPSDPPSIAFAVAVRGNMLLPRDGSWSMVSHDRGTGEVTPVAQDKGVAVIRKGVVRDVDSAENNYPTDLEIFPSAQDVLLRVAEPAELLRDPGGETVNYGLLQSMDTQKALFLTPAYQEGETCLCSKTPPLFADTFRIVNSKAVFPNVGAATLSDSGNAIALLKKDEFDEAPLLDQNEKTFRIMDVIASADNSEEVGFKLLEKLSDDNDDPEDKVKGFNLPDEFELIDLGDGFFRIYLEYKQDDEGGKLDFDIDSAAADLGKRWQSNMSKLGIVVDLGFVKRLMTIRGNWQSSKGASATYPEPDIVFADELQPVIDILEILQQLKGGDYGAALKNGLKLAMSNKAGSWEYKFEASKEIPLLRFPFADEVYNNPNTPLKLEAGMTLGAYFNSALKITTSESEFLPSAGGFLGFYGRLSVMCVSLSVGTIYALGQVNLDIAADTKTGPSLHMKFGFGAQIVIGLPVAGHVSVLFVVGVEIVMSETVMEVSAFMLFEGHAEILGGIVSITIRIEAKGTISRYKLPPGSEEERTDLISQVTFGLDISIFLVININFEKSWSEQRQIA